MKATALADQDCNTLREAGLALRRTSTRLEELAPQSSERELHARLIALADLLAAHADRLDRLRGVVPTNP